MGKKKNKKKSKKVHTDLPVYDPRGVVEEKPLWFERESTAMEAKDVMCPPMTAIIKGFEPQSVPHRKVDIGGGRILHTTAPAEENPWMKSAMQDACVTHKQNAVRDILGGEPIKASDLVKNFKGIVAPGMVDVNDKQAMDDVIRGNKKRKKKR